MKAFKIAISIMMCIPLYSCGQSTESEVVQEKYKADPYISIILNNVPSGWNFTATDSTFTFSSPDTIWELSENRINAPYEKSEDRNARIMQFGKRVVPKLVIEYRPKWGLDEMQKAMIINSSIEGQIKQLPEKIGIDHLYDPMLSRKSGPVYTPTNEKEKKLIELYYTELQKLESSMMKSPDFHSEQYSLFIKEIRGVNDDMNMVYPDKPSLELYTLLGIFREVCGK